MNKAVLKQIKALRPGDLILIKWFDASVGSSLSRSGIRIPVRTWGVYVGSIGKPKHIIIAQNDFVYEEENIRDEDYTVVPEVWTNEITIFLKAHISKEEAKNILTSIIAGRGSRRRRKWQRRAVNSENLD